MPTGYTYPVAEGKITDFADFAITCARAFGACVTMRDEPTDKPIPDEFRPSTYNADRLAEARVELARLEAMTPEQVAEAAEADYAEKKAHYDKYEAEQAAAEERICAMLEKVRTWKPPTAEHVGLRDFMIEQLEISRRGVPAERRAAEPERLEPAAWHRQKIEALHRDVGYHAAEQAKEEERTRGRNAWLRSLRDSLARQ